MASNDLDLNEIKALVRLFKYGGAEDCRSSHEDVAAFESLARKGLVQRTRDETYITESGKAVAATIKGRKV